MTREQTSVARLIVCVVVVTMTGSQAAQLESHCKFPQLNYGDPDLSRIAPLIGKRFGPITDKYGEYTYYMGICTTATTKDLSNETEAGIIQIIPRSNKSVILGKFTHSELKIGTDWAMLEYRQGTPYGHHCQGAPRTAIIMIKCDPDVTSIEDVNPVLIEEENRKVTGCYFLFELSHSSICNYRDKPAVTFRQLWTGYLVSNASNNMYTHFYPVLLAHIVYVLFII